MIWSLPNGLQAYAIFGAWAQRRVDAFTQIVRDPRIQRYVADKTNSRVTGPGRSAAVTDQRLGVASCAGCHIDGMNRANNNIRDWLDEGGQLIPKGDNGAGAWINDPATVKRVRLALLLMVTTLYSYWSFSLTYLLPFWAAFGIAASLVRPQRSEDLAPSRSRSSSRSYSVPVVRAT